MEEDEEKTLNVADKPVVENNFDIGNPSFIPDEHAHDHEDLQGISLVDDDNFEQGSLKEETSLSSTSLDPLVQSPHRPKPKDTMQNVSPELLHLVDSAIMGKLESLDKLKNIVTGAESFGSGDDDAETIAFLIVIHLV
ncbi:BnaC04g55320D [Brassica napus]|uniref:BnaC04g55320D protein n=1 Tax=Brassica napus TaxID=3708 RepID=A0A078INS2_BRANA|nr:BnaC04g55320D [Brassica napus]